MTRGGWWLTWSAAIGMCGVQVGESILDRKERSKGFAHRFRPTYAGANVGHPCGVVVPARGLSGRAMVPHISKSRCGAPGRLSLLAACWVLRGRGDGPAGRWRKGRGEMRCDNDAPVALPVGRWPASGCPPESKRLPPQTRGHGCP
jgi:hypothetical protein